MGLLLVKGADINLNVKGNGTPLCTAAQEGREDTFAWLVAAGADVRAQDGTGGTLLMAASKRQKRMVELLLAKGVGINARDPDGRTALHAVAGNGDPNATQWLISLGADVNARDKDSHTPLYAATHCMWSCVAGIKYRRVIELLLARGANVNARDKSGNTPLAQRRHSWPQGRRGAAVGARRRCEGGEQQRPNAIGRGLAAGAC
jgi:ankyrin repeat protein